MMGSWSSGMSSRVMAAVLDTRFDLLDVELRILFITIIPNLNCLEVPATLPGRGHGGLPALRPRSPRARSGSRGPRLGREEVV